MKAHELDTAQKKNRTRAGRGISAGRGKTAGRGTKGQNARSGGKRRSGFEGGQNPIFQRLPKKRGFTSFKQSAATVTTEQLDALGATVNNETLFEAGLIEDPHTSVKVIVKGEVSKKHSVQLQGASKSAIAAIEKAGGTFAAVERKQRTAKKSAE